MTSIDIELPLATVVDDEGTRLHRIEVYNWGTFHGKVWSFDLNGKNALLTGDIGSGKSTLVDAVTTLLIQANRISYNKAAGAETRERDLRSYVLGHHRTERDETTGRVRQVGLRGPGDYSVILGVFKDETRAVTTTIAQVFRPREDDGQPERFYVVADDELRISEHFGVSADSLADLRKHLKGLGATVTENFKEYRRTFLRKLGIASEQALDLFLQTVSMKAVDNLDTFVRTHMLERHDMTGPIDSLIAHFDDLTQAYESVVRARNQLELLTPLIERLDEVDVANERLELLRNVANATPFYFAIKKRELLVKELDRATAELAQLTEQFIALEEEIAALRRNEKALDLEIAGHGGNRIAALEQRVQDLGADLAKVRSTFDQYNDRLVTVGLEPVHSAAEFGQRQGELANHRGQLDELRSEFLNELTDLAVRHQQASKDQQAIAQELESLQSRTSNIPREQLELRAHLCDDLGLSAHDVPFAGELMAVDSHYGEWEGAAERVLRNLALSLLVPNDAYMSVAQWIDSRRLRGRIVYYRVPDRVSPAEEPHRSAMYPLLADMIDIHPETRYEPWLRRRLNQRANYACVPGTSAFSSVERALTPHGQVKGGDRHEKDDRFRVDDRRHWVLGWENQRKIEALSQELDELTTSIAELEAATRAAKEKQARVDGQASLLTALTDVQSWSLIDVATVEEERDAANAELARLKSASDELVALHQQLERVVERINDRSEARSQVDQRRGSMRGQIENRSKELASLQILLADEERLDTAAGYFDAVHSVLDEQVTGLMESITTIDEARRSVVDRVTDSIQTETDSVHRIERQAERVMSDFATAYPRETDELDRSIASAQGYREIHQRVANDDLPRFEQDFKTSLRENTINEIAQLSAGLDGQRNDIRLHIETINGSLVNIDYNDGRYIRLVPEATPNQEIRVFREDLKACTAQFTRSADDDNYSEQRFLQVKALIDRLKGREGFADVDRAWRQRVTDVRQWFVFSASERWRRDDSEYENYASSSGKSGGQKEKLAYTVLAASLAYQFRVGAVAGAGSFRFVAIDEAFGRGSDDSTRYGLKLFETLGLQLLIITPLQKIRVIEPYVTSVGFVMNPEENNSQLVQMTIEEHQRTVTGDSPEATRA